MPQISRRILRNRLAVNFASEQISPYFIRELCPVSMNLNHLCQTRGLPLAVNLVLRGFGPRFDHLNRLHEPSNRNYNVYVHQQSTRPVSFVAVMNTMVVPHYRCPPVNHQHRLPYRNLCNIVDDANLCCKSNSTFFFLIRIKKQKRIVIK